MAKKVTVNILERILDKKRVEIETAKTQTPLSQLVQKASDYPAPRSFAGRIRETAFPAIIAEIKRASPSKGIIRADLDPVTTAQEYAASGAAALSILTDQEFFKGELPFISQVRAAVPEIPILRKDFIIDPYQIWESLAAGADAILLIVKALDASSLQELYAEAQSAGLDVLIETHSIAELESALSMLSSNPETPKTLPLIGVNNRNLDSFEVSLETTSEVAGALAERQAFEQLLLVAESGIHSAEDVNCLAAYGAKVFLIGESLVRQGSPGENLAQLIKSSRCKREGQARENA